MPGRGVRVLEVKALFWSLDVRLPREGPATWKLRLAIIERLREAVWAVIDEWHNGRPA